MHTAFYSPSGDSPGAAAHSRCAAGACSKSFCPVCCVCRSTALPLPPPPLIICSIEAWC